MDDTLQWASDTFKALNLTWSTLNPIAKYPKDTHIIGMTQNRVAGVDLVLTGNTIRTATVITPINGDYILLPAFVVTVTSGVDWTAANMWLANLLRQLNKQRIKERQATIGKVKAVASVTTLGVFTLTLTGR